MLQHSNSFVFTPNSSASAVPPPTFSSSQPNPTTTTTTPPPPTQQHQDPMTFAILEMLSPLPCARMKATSQSASTTLRGVKLGVVATPIKTRASSLQSLDGLPIFEASMSSSRQLARTTGSMLGGGGYSTPTVKWLDEEEVNTSLSSTCTRSNNRSSSNRSSMTSMNGTVHEEQRGGVSLSPTEQQPLVVKPVLKRSTSSEDAVDFLLCTGGEWSCFGNSAPTAATLQPTSPLSPTRLSRRSVSVDTTPISLTSPHTANLILTIDVATLAGRGGDQCWVDEEDGCIVVGSGFCSGLQCHSIYFEGTQRIKSIGNGMLRGCSAQRISFGPMPQLQKVGNDWISGCTQLRRIHYAGDFTSLKYVGNGWLKSCSQIQTLDFSVFKALQCVGDGWMKRCVALAKIHVGDLIGLHRIGTSCLSKCPLLVEVAFSNLPLLTSVGDGWLSDCPRLDTAAFNALPRLSCVGSGWIAACPSITSVSLMGTDGIATVGPGWLLWSDGPKVHCSDSQRTRIHRLIYSSLSAVVSVDTKTRRKTSSSTPRR